MADEQQDVYTPAQAREWQEGRGHRDADEVHAHGATVRDERLSRYLSMVETHYQPATAEKPAAMPGQSHDLQHVRDIVAVEGTETFRAAMDAGDMQTLKHFTGDRGQRADISGIKAIDELRDEMTGPAPMFYMWAEPGTGKSNFACLLGQLWKEQKPADALVASNIRTLRETDQWSPAGRVEGDDVLGPNGQPVEASPRDGWLANYDELNEWLKQDGNPMRNDQRPKLFIFDEASSNAGGGGSDGYETKKKMGPLAYKIRKYGGSLIVIGHDGKDVHPLIRELGTAVHKEGLKEATFYDDVKKRDGVNERFSVCGIPETDWRYDDKEATTWSWSRDDDEEQLDEEEIEKQLLIGLTIHKRKQERSVRETADIVGMSTGWVSTKWTEYCDDGEHRAALNRFTEVIA